MTDEERAAHLEWCRGFIDRHCIFRSPPDRVLLTSAQAGVNSYQFYLPVATLNQEFARRIALLFWQLYADRPPFQICACESGGVPLASALQALAYQRGRAVNAFMVKKAQKTYGIKNWLEGTVIDRLPVLLVDDVVGAKKTLTTQAGRLADFGLDVAEAFAVASCNLKPPLALKRGERSIPISVLFCPHDFVKSHAGYLAKYGKPPQFHGTVV
jgi:orotate phosphoribosyltransferase